MTRVALAPHQFLIVPVMIRCHTDDRTGTNQSCDLCHLTTAPICLLLPCATMSVNDERAAVKKELSATQEKLAALASKIAVAESSGKADKVAKLKKKQSKYEAKVSELKAKKKALKAGKRKRGGDDEDGAAEQAPAAAGGSSDKRQRTGAPAADAAGSNGNGGAGGADAAPQKRVRGPRGGVSRLFAGNLSFKITADKLISFLQGNATHIMWLTDKETGRF